MFGSVKPLKDEETIVLTTTTSDALSQEPQVPTITIRVTVLNDWGYPERNLQTKFGMPEYYGLEMKARKKDGVSPDGVRLIFDSDTPVSLELEDRERLTFRIPRYVMAMDVSDM